MVKYKSLCKQPKTFYGVTFHYGDTKAVPGYIHDARFICLGFEPSKQEEAPKVESHKQAVPKKEVIQKEEPKKVVEKQPEKSSKEGKPKEDKKDK